MTNYLISIVGPTAIGKTALSILLANYFNTEIISADSRQFYKEMTIGTAVPTSEELLEAKHHFIHHKSIAEDYNVGAFEKEAIELLNNLFQKHNVVIMVGGSGLYVDAVTKGLDEFPKIDKSIRLKLNERLDSEGIASLQSQLKLLDPLSYDVIAIDNPHRVIRALEICLGSGQPYSSFLNKNATHRNFKTITIGLDAPRELIYERIENRVDQMIENGLLEEVKSLIQYSHLNALNTVGYKELFQYFSEQCTLDFAISEIKKNTRRFAKRQLTWFRRNKKVIWFDHQTKLNEITKVIKQQIKKPA
jgi:tRNA dimethylallyltransferase